MNGYSLTTTSTSTTNRATATATTTTTTTTTTTELNGEKIIPDQFCKPWERKGVFMIEAK
jgi:hypothetical protein